MKQVLLNNLLAKNQHSLAVLGLGLTGASCVRFLLSKGLQATLFDSREQVTVPSDFSHLNLHLGEQALTKLKEFSLIVLSPGFPRAHPMVQAAIAAGSKVVGDIELFALEANAPVVAITGSNGKSTVTSLLGEMAKACGKNVAVGGNIGVPALDLLATNIDLYVLELSSFQLESTESLHCVAATVLNLSEDHMDRYPSYDAYCETKHKIYKHAINCIYNADDALTYPKITASKASFGIHSSADFNYEANSNNLCQNDKLLVNSCDLAMVGEHNYANVLAAFALANASGLNLEGCAQAAKNYQGLEHRCQLLRRIDDVAWINDSKATNLGATLAAIDGLSSSAKHLWLIAGGDSKNADLSSLSNVQQKITGIVAFGKDKTLFEKLHPEVKLVEHLADAVAYCKTKAQAGDYVLLSPCCASLDMYKNYMARGEHFQELVGQL
ncbi:UDP-N-acetylmuramoyl-L-alanine--D-glutamate ligase [Alginatibacterium sediminis]|uniref:UDP-N-acetylmuramoylalanine--D-glutamate ligase n=1 Tax=Alginatibacterium sediminis TaxID=2164068 RepID=A0A420E8V0_9ALTE|nr:UDP-N-acetylmuramoyl-L-alanine--D-glutamate ligase [Alginatibacterium sediminis]RKF15886.1 UDP-N-acetylmuramoyl-L-alanine--D-glutamate ligase [Alginatibacterium sediminis]